MTTYECSICGWIYDEAKGCPEEGIPLGTRWEDVPEDWHCPVCGAGKADFNMVPGVNYLGRSASIILAGGSEA